MKLGLNVKFICYTVFIIVFISFVFSVVFIYQSRNAILDEFRKRAHALVTNLALNIEVPLFIENMPALNSFADNLLKEKEVHSVTIFNAEHQPLVALFKADELKPWQEEKIVETVYFSPETTDTLPFVSGEDALATTGEAVVPGRVIGTIAVVFSREGMVLAIDRMRWWIFIAATFAVIIGGIAGLYFSRNLIMPIQRLAKAAYSIARGNWNERLDVQRTDELGQLTESFNIMTESLITKKQELEHTYRELARKEKMAEIGKFSMIIAHELKNPLGIIKGSVDILAKKATQPATKETMIQYIKDEVKRLDKLINDFLSFARPAPPQKMPADLNSIITRIAQHFVVPAEENKQVSLGTQLAELPQISVDENQMHHALLNLINNAVQAIKSTGSICIQTLCSNDRITITVRDTGAGMSGDTLERAFDPFFTTKAKGTGLGLSIVKKIVNSHEGDITAAPAPDGGTCIEIVLPVITAQDQTPDRQNHHNEDLS